MNENSDVRRAGARRRRVAALLALTALAVAGGVAPLVVRAHFVSLDPSVAQYLTGEPIFVDFFAWHKMRIVLACGAACLLALLLAPTWEPRACLVYGGLALYLAGLLASTLLSPHPALARWGFPGRYEGAYVLTSYALLMVTALHHVHTARRVRGLLAVVAGSSLAIALIGAAQLAGHDLLLTRLGRWLIVPDLPHAHLGGMAANTLPGMITSTLYNPNYVGSYMAMLGPLCLGLSCAAQGRRMRGSLLVLTALLYLNLLGAQSRAGLLAGGVATLVVLVAVGRLGRAPRRRLGLLAAVLVLAGVAAHLASQGRLSERLATLASEFKALGAPRGAGLAVRRIDVRGHELEFATTHETLRIRQANGRLAFTDGTQPLRVFPNDRTGALTFRDPRFREYRLVVHPNDWLELERRGLPTFRFHWMTTGFRLLDARGEPVPASVPQAWLAAGRESLGSGRFYIWARSLPLLRASLLRGGGPDTFAARFPQDDLVLKANVYGRLNVVVDKPHSAYLQTAINTGGVSLLGLLVVFVHYTWASIHLYIRRPSHAPLAPLGASLFAGFCGYAIASCFNDSVVSVAPTFWTLLGIGIAVNAQIHRVNNLDAPNRSQAAMVTL